MRFSISAFLNLCDSQLVLFSISVFLNLCDSQLVFFSICAILNLCNSQLVFFSIKAIWARHRQLDDSLVGQLTTYRVDGTLDYYLITIPLLDLPEAKEKSSATPFPRYFRLLGVKNAFFWRRNAQTPFLRVFWAGEQQRES